MQSFKPLYAAGRMALRFQPDADEPLTFIDLKAAAAVSLLLLCVMRPLSAPVQTLGAEERLQRAKQDV